MGLCLLFLANSSFSQKFEKYVIKPTIVSKNPAFEEYLNAKDIKKISKTKKIVVAQFNLNLAIEEKASITGGGTKKYDSDASVGLNFALVNLDKKIIQDATNELHQYLIDQLKAAGFDVISYEKFKAEKNFEDLSRNEPLNGNSIDVIPAMTALPGYPVDRSRSKFIGFSANNMPSFDMLGIKYMKFVKLAKNIDADVLGFGLSLHFLEFIAKANKIGGNTMAEVSEVKINLYTQNPQLYILANPGYIAQVTGNTNKYGLGYSFGKEFITEIKTGDNQSWKENSISKENKVYIDNEKLKAVLIELVKSYIDNMVSGLTTK